MMQTNNRILDDLARAASGALGLAAGVKSEVEARLRGALERWMKEQDFVAREEFEAVKTMAAQARSENESLLERVAALEAKLAEKTDSPG
jgi:BMFP domain-containing protein YqiC